MMPKYQSNEREQLETLTIEQLVPKDHLVRKLDAAYKTPAITSFLLGNHMLPVVPYTRPKTKEGFFRKHEYVYDEYLNAYICPNNQLLTHTMYGK